MRVKRLFNTSEYKTNKILETVLRETGYTVRPELALNKVLQMDEDEVLSRPERNTLNSSSFDNVVYNRESWPEFAVEFDGPHHHQDAKQRASDIRKNLLCQKARFPFLRIGDDFLAEYEKTTLLEYLIQRFVAWKKDHTHISEEQEEICSYLASRGASEMEYERIDDPVVMWDLLHPFPESTNIAQGPLHEVWIVSSHIDPAVYEDAVSQAEYLFFQMESSGAQPIGLYHYSVERGFGLRKMTCKASGHYDRELMHSVTAAVSYQWRLPTVDLFTPASKSRTVLEETVHGQQLPGVSVQEVAEHFCDFIAFRQLKTWAVQNMSECVPARASPTVDRNPSLLTRILERKTYAAHSQLCRTARFGRATVEAPG